MEDDYKNKFAIIAILLILCAFAAGRIPLGIDLEGGAELTYSVETRGIEESEVPNLMGRAVTVIRNRIDPAGTAGYVVNPSDDRILITMGGAKSTEIHRVQKLLKKSGRLEMRLELREQGYRPEDYVRALKARVAGEENPVEGTRWYTDNRGRPVLVEDEVYITGEMLRNAIPEPAGDGFTWKVALQFDAAKGGVEALRKISKIAFDNNESGMAIILNDLRVNGEIVKPGICDSSPSVRSTFNNGFCEITGGYDKAQADELVTLLDSGSLPFEVRPESAVIVGPSLGEESIRRGGMSCAVGLGLIFVFMLFYYGQLGFIANFCLSVNLFLVWVGMAKFGFVLTLPGIAGVLLTIGMAVDANVLIFERIKEELREGHPMARAVQTGYEKAFVAIFDANLTTFITGVILYVFGSGPVKGFAITLCLGIAASMFSAIYVSRACVDWLMALGRLREASRRRLYNGNVDFLGGLRVVMSTLSVLAVVSALVFVFKKGEDNLGLDFRGGTRLQIAFVDSQDKLEIRETAQQALNALDEPFKDDLEVIPVHVDTDPEGLFSQFILKTKISDNEKVERTLIKTFEGRLRPTSLVDDEALEPLKFISFTFTASRELDADQLEGDLRRALSDPGLIVVPKEDMVYQVLVTPGRSLQEVQGFLAGSLGDRLRPENIRWNPMDPTKVLVKLLQPTKIEEFLKNDLETLDDAYKGVTGKSADPDSISSEWASLIELTLPGPVDTMAFENRLINETGLVQPSPMNEGEILDRVAHVRLRVKTTGPQELASLIGPEGYVILEAEESPGGMWQMDMGKPGFDGDADDLEGELTSLLEARVSNPIVANTTIRGNVAREMSLQALWALFWSLLAIIIYITYRFEFRFGVASIFALVHDVSISLGVLSILGIEYDLTIVGALLTVVGYSLNDTIVIFDRIRENLRLWAAKPIREVINISINQTLSRTMLTSITTLIVVCVLRFWGGDDLAPFSTALICGVLVGTYSSIFVASPLLVLFGSGLRSSLRPVDDESETMEPAPATDA